MSPMRNIIIQENFGKRQTVINASPYYYQKEIFHVHHYLTYTKAILKY